MASDGIRRSRRVRKAVKTYAEEQAEQEDAVAITKRTAKRKRTTPVDDDEDRKEDELAAPKKSRRTAEVDAEYSPPTKSKGKAPAKKKVAEPSSSKPTKAKIATTGRHWHEEAAERRIEINKRIAKNVRPGEEEMRLRDYVAIPPASYKAALNRATTQRMFVLNRERDVEDVCHAHHTDCPCETIELAGSTGNVYTVEISHLPSCTCPVGIFKKKSNEQLCKHILYVLHFVLKASDELKQQNAFLTSELRELFHNAPPLPSAAAADDSAMDGKRKPVEDDCPICCMEFKDQEDIVWCRAACGNNIHKACFDQWAQAKTGKVTCPFCRSDWESDKSKSQKTKVTSVKMPVERGERGYRNVRDQLEYDV